MKIIVYAVFALAALSPAQDHGWGPTPEQQAKVAAVTRLRHAARAKELADDLPGALELYREAVRLEAATIGRTSVAQGDLAACLYRAGLHREAVNEYRQALKWSGSNRDIFMVGASEQFSKCDYAISLAKLDRREDAKAVYYSVLRELTFDDRGTEPVPFIAVFDPDPEGLFYEYTPERFEAACLLLRCRQEGFPWTRLEQIRRLWPEWFLAPLAFAAKSRDPLLLDEADSLARSPLEREIVATCRREIAEHEQHEREMGFVHPTSDKRPMRAGRERRARMQSLRPDEARLRALSDGERP